MLVPVQAGYSQLVSMEAEDCALADGAVLAADVYGTEYPGYSGAGFVWVANAGTLTFQVSIPENGMYELSTRCWMYLGNEGETMLQVYSINGQSQGDFYIPNQGGWIDFSFGYAYIERGTATIEIGSSGSWGFILYDTVTFDYADMPDYNISSTPCDGNATTVFLTLVNDTNDTKMVALSELDKIPDIQNIGNEGAWWLYFCPWYGSFITDGTTNPTSLLYTIYNSQYVLTMDEMPFSTTTTSTYSTTTSPGGGTLGEVNNDGSINIVDALLIAQYYVGLITQFC